MLTVNAQVVVPVNVAQLIDDTDFKTIKSSVAYNAAGLSLAWNFLTNQGTLTQTAVTPTSGGSYPWVNLGGGIYGIGLPPTGTGVINNQPGEGWFNGVATGILPFVGPRIKFGG